MAGLEQKLVVWSTSSCALWLGVVGIGELAIDVARVRNSLSGLETNWLENRVLSYPNYRLHDQSIQ